MIKCFQAIDADYSSTNFTLTLLGLDKIEGAGSANSKNAVDAILKKNGCLIAAASLHVKGFYISFAQGGFNDKSGVFDEIKFHESANANQRSTLDFDSKIDIVARVTSTLGASQTARKSILSPEHNQSLAIHESTLNRLESLNETLIEGSEEFRRKIEQEAFDLKQQLREDFQKRKDRLDQQAEKRQKELAEEQEELQARIKEIDDRDNTHVRRGLREQILTEIKNRSEHFSLTSGTNRLRLPIHIACIVSVAALIIALILYTEAFVRGVGLYGEKSDLTAVLLVAIKQAGLSIATIALVTFYIKWMNSWFTKHADAEFKLKQFQLDIERASWVVESSLEWKESKGSSIPMELLDRISAGLFSSHEGQTEESNPKDELASALLGTASQIKLNVNGNEVLIDGKRLRKSGDT